MTDVREMNSHLNPLLLLTKEKLPKQVIIVVVVVIVVICMLKCNTRTSSNTDNDDVKRGIHL